MSPPAPAGCEVIFPAMNDRRPYRLYVSDRVDGPRADRRLATLGKMAERPLVRIAVACRHSITSRSVNPNGAMSAWVTTGKAQSEHISSAIPP